MASPVARPLTGVEESRKRRRFETPPDASSIQRSQSLDSSYPSVIYTVASQSPFDQTFTPISHDASYNLGSCFKAELLKAISTPNLVDTSCESGGRYGHVNLDVTPVSRPAVPVNSWIAPRARLKSALNFKASSIQSDSYHHDQESPHFDSFAGQNFNSYDENSRKGNPRELHEELQLSECESLDSEISNTSSSGISYNDIDNDNECNAVFKSENDETSMQFSGSAGISYADSCSLDEESETRQEINTCDELRTSLFAIENSLDREDDEQLSSDTDTDTAGDDYFKSSSPKKMMPEVSLDYFSKHDSPESEILDEEDARKVLLNVTKRNVDIADANAILMKQIVEKIYSAPNTNNCQIEGLYEDLTLSDFIEQPTLRYSTQTQDCILFDDIDAPIMEGCPDDELNQEAFEQEQAISRIVEPTSQQMKDVIAGLQPMKFFSPVEYNFDCKSERWYAQISPHISGVYYYQPSSGELSQSPPSQYIDTSDVRRFADQMIKARVATSPQCHHPRSQLSLEVDCNMDPDDDFIKLVTPVSRTKYGCEKKALGRSILKNLIPPRALARIKLSFALIVFLVCAFRILNYDSIFSGIFGAETVAYNLMSNIEHTAVSPSTLYFISLVSRQCFCSDLYCTHVPTEEENDTYAFIVTAGAS